jgi:hypothetical protein
MAEILACFRSGRSTFLSALIRPRIERILFAATKADHLHHTSHDRLEHVLARMTRRAAERAKFSGALVDVVALAAIRATREATVDWQQQRLPSIIGTPVAGETAGGETFEGETETAMFPGDLPDDPAVLFDLETQAFRGLSTTQSVDADYRFLRFRPPRAEKSGDGVPVPHIRLDRALQFLLGDRLA